MVELRVSSNDYNCELVLERRITYIRGDSGVGKTGLIDRITSYVRGDIAVKVECSRNLIALDSITSKDMFSAFRGLCGVF